MEKETILFTKVRDLNSMMLRMDDWCNKHPEYTHSFIFKEDGVYIKIEKQCNKKK